MPHGLARDVGGEVTLPHHSSALYRNLSFRLSTALSIASDKGGTAPSGLTSVVQMKRAPDPPLGAICIEAL